MLRFLVLFFFGFLFFSSRAQDPAAGLQALNDTYGKIHTENEKPGDKSLANILAFLKPVAALADNIEKAGSGPQKEAGRFFQILLKYETGIAYKQAAQHASAYDIYKETLPLFETAKNSFSFPVEYVYSNTRHSFNRPTFDEQYYLFYGSYGSVCVSLGKYDEAKTYIMKALEYSQATLYFRYQQSSLLYSARKKVGIADSEFVSTTLLALKHWSRLDTANKRKMIEGKYFNGSGYTFSLRDAIPKARDLKNKAAAYASAAYYLDSLHEDRTAEEFYRYALNADSSDRAVLWQINTYAKRTGNTEWIAASERNLQRVYANEPDEVVRNLGTALFQIIPNASDPTRHLKDIQGRSFRVNHIGGKNYHSDIELKGALETYTHEFLKNNMNDYYYWSAIIDDEPKADLNGRLRARYNAICNEVRNLYPQSPVVYSYNNINYFSMQINPSVTLEINYFYSEGYKDRILLSVISQMPKGTK